MSDRLLIPLWAAVAPPWWLRLDLRRWYSRRHSRRVRRTMARMSREMFAEWEWEREHRG